MKFFYLILILWAVILLPKVVFAAAPVISPSSTFPPFFDVLAREGEIISVSAQVYDVDKDLTSKNFNTTCNIIEGPNWTPDGDNKFNLDAKISCNITYGYYNGYTIQVTDGEGNIVIETYWINLYPKAVISPVRTEYKASPPGGDYDIITFDVSSSYDEGDLNMSYDCGNGYKGQNIPLQNFQCYYRGSDLYRVTLEVTETQLYAPNVSDVATAVVMPKPAAGFSCYHDFDSLTYDFRGSAYDESAVSNWSWDFGDGTTDTGKEVRHTYPYHAAWEATISVTYDDGYVTSRTKSLNDTCSVGPSPGTDAPTNLHHTDNKTDQITWAWDGKASYWKLYDNKEVYIKSCNSSLCDLTGLKPNTDYGVKVKACDAEGNCSNFGSVQPGHRATDKKTTAWAYTSANVPKNLAGTVISKTQINWSWESGGAQKDFYAYNEAGNSGWTTAVSWDQKGLNSNTTYKLYVKARNGDNDETNAAGPLARTTSCVCDSWVNQGCGANSCKSDEIYWTRNCTPDLCDIEEKCVYDAVCKSPPPNIPQIILQFWREILPKF